mmetsp:Transcript_16921/g.36793  ORF Transcript_16921/g.36793 Transcript_16921/m.36793 type:complete len:477 (+) Transcript_16921:159-1589(+)
MASSTPGAVIAASIASGGPESLGWLNDIISQLWERMSIVGSDMVKESVEPSFAELPGPLSSLHFTNIDLGKTPIKFDRIDVHTKNEDCIKLDIDVIWDGDCDIALKANVLGSFGVKSVKLEGRLSVLMLPLIDRMPIVSAVQVAFINPPKLDLDFTGMANIADLSIIDQTIRNTIHDSMAAMMVLPDRMLIKMDPANDFFQTYQEPIGIVRLTIVSGGGFKIQGRLLNKDVPDVFVKTKFAGFREWTTSTKNNTTSPEWNESKDFVLSDDDQLITLDAYDSDGLSSHDDLGIASITVGELLLSGKTKDVKLVKKGKVTGAHIVVKSDIFSLVPDLISFESPEYAGSDSLCGLLTVLVAQAFNIPVEKDEANVSVKIAWGKEDYSTAAVIAAPGIDALNPSFDTPFLLPLTQEKALARDDVVFTLLNGGTEEIGTASVPYSTLVDSPSMMVTGKVGVGQQGAMLQFRVSLRGLQLAE